MGLHSQCGWRQPPRVWTALARPGTAKAPCDLLFSGTPENLLGSGIRQRVRPKAQACLRLVFSKQPSVTAQTSDAAFSDMEAQGADFQSASTFLPRRRRGAVYDRTEAPPDLGRFPAHSAADTIKALFDCDFHNLAPGGGLKAPSGFTTLNDSKPFLLLYNSNHSTRNSTPLLNN